MLFGSRLAARLLLRWYERHDGVPLVRIFCVSFALSFQLPFTRPHPGHRGRGGAVEAKHAPPASCYQVGGGGGVNYMTANADALKVPL